jgi:hypothetical protein
MFSIVVEPYSYDNIEASNFQKWSMTKIITLSDGGTK